MKNRITSVSVVHYPVIRVEFDDGFLGEFDLSDLIAAGPSFARLKDRSFFEMVAVDPSGYVFGWNLDDPGNEIDLCSDATRIQLETKAVEALAAEYRLTHSAAECSNERASSRDSVVAKLTCEECIHGSNCHTR